MDADPLCLWREQVRDEWIDYNGHLSEAYYVLVLGHATDLVMAAVGIDAEYRAAASASLYTVEAHVRYLDEVPAAAALEVRSWVVGSSGKLLWIWHELYAGETLRATEEVLGLHVVGEPPAAAPFPDDIRSRVEGALVTPPPEASRAIRLG